MDEEILTRPLEGEASFSHWTLPELDREVGAVDDIGVPALPTVEELERIRVQAVEEGRRQGHAEGYAAGHAEGMEQAREEIEHQQTRLRGWLASLSEPLANLDNEVSHQLARLAMQIAAAVLRRELTIEPEAIERVAREAISALPQAEGREISIHCHPDDIDGLREVAGERGWALRPDPAVAAGGLWIEAGDARVDATLESRWAQMSARLLAMDVPGPTAISESLSADVGPESTQPRSPDASRVEQAPTEADDDPSESPSGTAP